MPEGFTAVVPRGLGWGRKTGRERQKTEIGCCSGEDGSQGFCFCFNVFGRRSNCGEILDSVSEGVFVAFPLVTGEARLGDWSGKGAFLRDVNAEVDEGVVRVESVWDVATFNGPVRREQLRKSEGEIDGSPAVM